MTEKRVSNWSSPIAEARWRGFRRVHRGIEAFVSAANFEQAELSELEESLDDYERETLGRLISRGNKSELEIFLRTHGANPIFPPQNEIDVEVGVAAADTVDLADAPSPEALRAVLNGDVVHCLCQAGEASRFQEGPFYNLNPLTVGTEFEEELNLGPLLDKVKTAAGPTPSAVAKFIMKTPLGPKQPVMLRAALRCIVEKEILAGRLSLKAATQAYKDAIARQKILFFVSSRSGVDKAHWEDLRRSQFFGFEPGNIVTIEQDLIRGLSCDDRGTPSFIMAEEAKDAAGHLYALLQCVRKGDFITYSVKGEKVRDSGREALEYLIDRGGKILSIVRINDMDRHTTEIINPKAVSYALKTFEKGYVNVIEGVSNPQGQKGGTGTTFGDPEIHVLTETHENSFPALSRAFEKGMEKYLKSHEGRHPAYNAMRQLSDLSVTRQALKEYGGRIVFVPRQKEWDGTLVSYLGVDMPMGDLSLLCQQYKSRMFQFVGPNGKELLIHDMKFKENLPVALATIERQLKDAHILAAAEEVLTGKNLEFKKPFQEAALYNAPAPEFD